MDNKLVGFLPLVRTNVHLECLYVLARLHKEVLGLFILADLGVVACDLDLVWTNLVSWLVLHEVHGTVPIPGLKS